MKQTGNSVAAAFAAAAALLLAAPSDAGVPEVLLGTQELEGVKSKLAGPPQAFLLACLAVLLKELRTTPGHPNSYSVQERQVDRRASREKLRLLAKGPASVLPKFLKIQKYQFKRERENPRFNRDTQGSLFNFLKPTGAESACLANY